MSTPRPSRDNTPTDSDLDLRDVQRGLHMICFGLHPDASEPAYVIGN